MQAKAKIRKSNKLVETLGSTDYSELSKEKALHLSLKNKKEVVEIVMEYQYK